MENYTQYLQPELAVNYCKLLVVTVDDPETTRQFRADLGANYPFLIDAERKLINELDIVDTTDAKHSPIPIPYTFVLDRTCEIYKILFVSLGFRSLREFIEDATTGLPAMMSRPVVFF